MLFIVIGIIIVVGFGAAIIFVPKMSTKYRKDTPEQVVPKNEKTELQLAEGKFQSLQIQMEMLPAEAIPDQKKLIEITDSKVLARVSNLIPGLTQTGIAANNIAHAVQASKEVLYRVIIPANAKLADSKAMEGAKRAFFHGKNGFGGHANLVAVHPEKGGAVVANAASAAMGVASMVVGQYYMTQINSELSSINDSISQVSDFLDNEYRSRVFSLVTFVKKIADFEVEILENEELRQSKISQLDNLEVECAQLLGQANLSLAGFCKKADLDYKGYEKALGESQKWFMYQKSLVDVLCKIADLRYTLHLGKVSREQCAALLPTYSKQVSDTQVLLTGWHQDTTKRLGINTEEIRRKRDGLDGVVHYIPGLFNHDLNFRSIEIETVNMISTQIAGHEDTLKADQSELYSKDVQLYGKDGKVYYLPSE